MTRDDTLALVQHLTATAEVLGQPLGEAAALMMASDLRDYPLAALLASLGRVRSEHTGRLTLRAILDRLDGALQRLAGNEAWAVAQRAQDERETVVWTDEIARAWTSAKPLMDGGDRVGARMAFLEAYERITREARQSRRPPEVLVSQGWDSTSYGPAIEHATRIGLLPRAEAAKLLAADHTPGAARRRGEATDLMPLLTTSAPAGEGLTPEQVVRLRALPGQLRRAARERAAAEDARWQQEQDDLARLKAEQLAAFGAAGHEARSVLAAGQAIRVTGANRAPVQEN